MAFLFACLENMFKKTFIIFTCFSFFSIGHSAKEGFRYNIAVSKPDLNKINKMLNKDNHNEAIKNYKKALSIDPNHKRTQNYLGITNIRVGNMEKSREHLQILKKLCNEKCEEYKALKKEINIVVLNEKN